MKTHDLKTWPVPFEAILDRRKRFEFRNNDRGFEVGDVLLLREWDPDAERYSDRWARAAVLWMTGNTQFGIPLGFCAMSIEVIDQGCDYGPA